MIKLVQLFQNFIEFRIECNNHKYNVYDKMCFRSDASFPSGGGSRRLYLCMKLTKVTPDLFYFRLLSGMSYLYFIYNSEKNAYTKLGT